MIIRISIAAFISLVSGFCYLSGMIRLISGLLIGFGFFTSLIFGIIFILPDSENRLIFPIHSGGASWPFFLLAVCLIMLIIYLFLKKSDPAEKDQLAASHMKFLAGGLFLYLCSLFVPAFLWFPSEEKRLAVEAGSLGIDVFIGVCIYLAGTGGALYLLYRATKGATEDHPDLMRRFVLALFSVFHLDKMPALVAYLLIYSPETYVIFPKIAALALAAYIPISVFFIKVSSDSHSVS